MEETKQERKKERAINGQRELKRMIGKRLTYRDKEKKEIEIRVPIKKRVSAIVVDSLSLNSRFLI